MSLFSFVKKHRVFIGISVLTVALFVGASAQAVVLESGIPGVGEGGAQGAEIPDLPTYVNYLYIFVLGIVGIAGFISLIVWGTVWVGSAVVDNKTRAMEGIKNTLTGIGIALTAFIMLYTINPDLTILKTPTADKLATKKSQNTSLPPGALGTSCKINGDCASRFCLATQVDISGFLIDGMCAISQSTTGGSFPDGKECSDPRQCLLGSICQGLILDATTVKLGTCARNVAGAYGTCFGMEATVCSPSGCKSCPAKDGSIRCLPLNSC